MRDLASVLWKEIAEFVGNARSLRVFAIAVLAVGILPSLSLAHAAHAGGGSASGLLSTIRVLYVLFAAAIVVANTAPDLVLHERAGRTFDYLLATRLPDYAIFGGKVLTAAGIGYLAGMVAMALQLATTAVLTGQGLNWLFLATPEGRIIAFGVLAALVLYMAVIGTFVALRVGEQRSAYLVTVLSLGLLLAPFLLGWIHIALTTQWFATAAMVFGAFAILLAVLGTLVFRRDMLVLYLQE